jgi:hypothetical protein
MSYCQNNCEELNINKRTCMVDSDRKFEAEEGLCKDSAQEPPT